MRLRCTLGIELPLHAVILKSFYVSQASTLAGLAVCLCVRLSVKRVDCDKTEERSFQILYHTKDHLA